MIRERGSVSFLRETVERIDLYALLPSGARVPMLDPWITERQDPKMRRYRNRRAAMEAARSLATDGGVIVMVRDGIDVATITQESMHEERVREIAYMHRAEVMDAAKARSRR